MTSRRDAPSVSSPLRDARGVTVLELVIALSLFTLVLGSIYAFVGTGGRSARVANDFLQTQPQARAALDNATDEIRWAQTVTCASVSAVTLLVPQNTPFSAASAYLVTFAYDPAADTLTRRESAVGSGCPPAGIGEPLAYSVVRADGSDGIAFEYFDGAGTSLGSAPADLTVIARVRITVSTTRNRVSRTFTGDVALRGR